MKNIQINEDLCLLYASENKEQKNIRNCKKEVFF